MLFYAKISRYTNTETFQLSGGRDMKKLLFVFALIVSAIPVHAQVIAPVEPVSLFTACMQTVPASVNYWQAAEYCDVQAARIRDRGLVYGRNYGPVGPVVGF